MLEFQQRSTKGLIGTGKVEGKIAGGSIVRDYESSYRSEGREIICFC